MCSSDLQVLFSDSRNRGVCEIFDFRVVEEQPTRIGFHRPPPVNDGVGMPAPFDVDARTQGRGQQIRCAIQHKAKGAVFVVLDDQHYGAMEVWILELRHGDEERGGQCLIVGHETKVAGSLARTTVSSSPLKKSPISPADPVGFRLPLQSASKASVKMACETPSPAKSNRHSQAEAHSNDARHSCRDAARRR